MGKRHSWYYYGDPGTNGVLGKVTKDGKQAVMTHGNPAAMPMYYATTEMRDNLVDIAREVFRR